MRASALGGVRPENPEKLRANMTQKYGQSQPY